MQLFKTDKIDSAISDSGITTISDLVETVVCFELSETLLVAAELLSLPWVIESGVTSVSDTISFSDTISAAFSELASLTTTVRGSLVSFKLFIWCINISMDISPIYFDVELLNSGILAVNLLGCKFLVSVLICFSDVLQKSCLTLLLIFFPLTQSVVSCSCCERTSGVLRPVLSANNNSVIIKCCWWVPSFVASFVNGVARGTQIFFLIIMFGVFFCFKFR